MCDPREDRTKRRKHGPWGANRVSVHLPERFSGKPPCTFGTQLNVFSRESSAFQSHPHGGYLRLLILRRAQGRFPEKLHGSIFLSMAQYTRFRQKVNRSGAVSRNFLSFPSGHLSFLWSKLENHWEIHLPSSRPVASSAPKKITPQYRAKAQRHT